MSQGATTSTLAASPGSTIFGQNVTLTATVSANAPGSGTPTGTVTYFDGTISIGSATLAGGTASIVVPSLAPRPIPFPSSTPATRICGRFVGEHLSIRQFRYDEHDVGKFREPIGFRPGRDVDSHGGSGRSGPRLGHPDGTVDFYDTRTSPA